MPSTEQNALVKKYCAVCHSDAAKNGGLSLDRYDAGRRDPGLAAMILSKLRNGAMGAAGNGVPDKAAQKAWLDSTAEQAAGATEWFVTRENASVVSAGLVREVPPRKPSSPDVPVYRILLTCDTATSQGEMLLTWSPEPQTGRVVAASVDGNTPVEYKLEGKESMGNGSPVQSGLAALVLNSRAQKRFPLASRSLTVRELFPGEAVEFSFLDLDAGVHSDLKKCFPVSR